MTLCRPKPSFSTLNHARKTLVASSSITKSRGYAAQAKAAKHEAQKTLETNASKAVLTWPEYLAIRRSRHRWQTAAMIPSSLVGFSSGILYFGSLETDPLKPIFGFDPFMVYGFLTLGCLGAGALAGPTIGGGLWRFTHRNQVDLIDEKEKEFLSRIAKNRVDVSLQTATAPVPDYYGERIGSLHQYRQWLRDQNKYRRKVVLPEKED